MNKPEWVKPTPYENYLHGVQYAQVHAAVGRPVTPADPDMRLTAAARATNAGVVAFQFGVSLAPRTR